MSFFKKFNSYTPELLLILLTVQCIYGSVTTPYTPLKIFKYSFFFWAFCYIVYHVFDIHARYGFFKVREPRSHFWFQMKSSWIVVVWALGTYWFAWMLGVSPDQPFQHRFKMDFIPWTLPEWMTIKEETPLQKYLGALVLFYVVDFCRYWGHRIGHYQFFYRTFPFSHAHHHNQVWITPTTLSYSPFWHLANFGTIAPYVLFWALGFKQATIFASVCLMFPNLNQHLGCDPLPWLTKLNHYYFYGALPWLPVYHQYHHCPYVKRGNYGNITVFWDYVHGTLIPESIEHIETGKMPQRVADKFKDPKKLEAEFEGKFKNRNRLDYNNRMDSSIFSMRFL